MSDLTVPVSPTPQDPVRDLSLGGRDALLSARRRLRQLEEQRNALQYLSEVAAVDHDLEAKVQALGIELNAPDHLIRQNFEQAAGLLEAMRIQDANLIEQAPVLYGQLHDPKWAAIAIDDWERLSFTEQLGRAIDREDYRKEIAEIQTEVIGKINAGVSYQEAVSAKDRARLLELDKKIEIFGKSRGEEMARAANAPLLGQIPIDPEMAKLCDAGDIERYDGDIVKSLGESLSKAAG